jgi:hypothetical protein
LSIIINCLIGWYSSTWCTSSQPTNLVSVPPAGNRTMHPLGSAVAKGDLQTTSELGACPSLRTSGRQPWRFARPTQQWSDNVGCFGSSKAWRLWPDGFPPSHGGPTVTTMGCRPTAPASQATWQAGLVLGRLYPIEPALPGHEQDTSRSLINPLPPA